MDWVSGVGEASRVLATRGALMSKRPIENSLTDQDIVTARKGRRTFVGIAAATMLGASAVAAGAVVAGYHDFPKGSSDSDVTENADLKSADSDQRNSKAVDSNQNRLRDVKRSTDSD